MWVVAVAMRITEKEAAVFSHRIAAPPYALRRAHRFSTRCQRLHAHVADKLWLIAV